MEYILNVRSFFVFLCKGVLVKYILRFPHHGYRSFTFVQDDDYRFPHYNSKSFANVSYDT